MGLNALRPAAVCQNPQCGQSALRPLLEPGRLQPFPGKKLLWDSPPPSGRSPDASRVPRRLFQRPRVLPGVKPLHDPNLSFPAWQVPASTGPVRPTPLHLADEHSPASVMGLGAHLGAACPAQNPHFACTATHRHTPSHSFTPTANKEIPKD